MTEKVPFTPFHPEPRDFPGHPMPTSVPEGMRLELSRAPVVSGKEDEFEEWMAAVNDRYGEHEEALSNERQVFEATFKHEEADGRLWIYHVSLMGTNGGVLDESLQMSADHGAYSRRVKAPGWEEMTPKFMLTPNHIGAIMTHWAKTGSID
ncbi:DUF6176 family protein [Cryobacterium gelidum]|nr:DUF6176 family protein [Cryobacterium gelidum]